MVQIFKIIFDKMSTLIFISTFSLYVWYENRWDKYLSSVAQTFFGFW